MHYLDHQHKIERKNQKMILENNFIVEPIGDYLMLTSDKAIQSEELSDLEIGMLTYNDIPGVASFRIEKQNTQVRFLYKKSGKKRLSEWISQYNPSLDDRILLLQKIINIIKDCPRYLLSVNRLAIEPDWIWIGENQEDIAIIYIPLDRVRSKNDIDESFARLFLFIFGSFNQARGLVDNFLSGKRTYMEGEKILENHTINPSTNYEIDQSSSHVQSIIEETSSTQFMDWLKPLFIKNKNKSKPTNITTEIKPNVSDSFVISPKRDLAPTQFLTNAFDTHNIIDFGSLEWENGGVKHFSTLEGTKFIIGRTEDANLTLYENGISRRHAEIEHGCKLTDLGSKNGTFLNGERLIPFKQYAIDNGDRIMFSTIECVFKKLPVS